MSRSLAAAVLAQPTASSHDRGAASTASAVTFAATDLGSGIASYGIRRRRPTDEDDRAAAASHVQPSVRGARSVPARHSTEQWRSTRRAISNGAHTLQVIHRRRREPDAVVARSTSRSGTAACPNGAAASQFARLDAWLRRGESRRRTAGVVPYGRTRPIIGRLATPEGAPIVGCGARRVATTGRPGSRARVIGQVVTDGNGAFTFTPKAASSRRITVSYRAYTLDAAASAVSDVVLQTRAGVRLSVRRSGSARAGSSASGPAPRRSGTRGDAGGPLRARRIAFADTGGDGESGFTRSVPLSLPIHQQLAWCDVPLPRDHALAAQLSVRDRQFATVTVRIRVGGGQDFGSRGPKSWPPQRISARG